MTLCVAVEQAFFSYPNIAPDWFDPDWAETRQDDFFAQAA
jgi:hypothetical protein